MSTKDDDLRDIYARLNTTEQEVASLGSKLDQVITTLDRVVERVTAPAPPPPKTDWVGIAALVVSIVTAGGLYVTSRFAPVEAAQEVTRAQLEHAFERELERERLLGKLETQAENNRDTGRNARTASEACRCSLSAKGF